MSIHKVYNYTVGNENSRLEITLNQIHLENSGNTVIHMEVFVSSEADVTITSWRYFGLGDSWVRMRIHNAEGLVGEFVNDEGFETFTVEASKFF